MTQPSLTAFFNRERLIAEQLCLLFAGRLHEALKEFLEKNREALILRWLRCSRRSYRTSRARTTRSRSWRTQCGRTTSWLT
ncbi:MAG: hypothetical protein QXQ28_01245 [Candidatus Nezhaarchaeales archaeon]